MWIESDGEGDLINLDNFDVIYVKETDNSEYERPNHYSVEVWRVVGMSKKPDRGGERDDLTTYWLVGSGKDSDAAWALREFIRDQIKDGTHLLTHEEWKPYAEGRLPVKVKDAPARDAKRERYIAEAEVCMDASLAAEDAEFEAIVTEKQPLAYKRLFGEALKAKRLQGRVSLRKFASIICADPSYISRLERGILEPTRDVERLRQILNELDLNRNWQEGMMRRAAISQGRIPQDFLESVSSERLLRILTLRPEDVER